MNLVKPESITTTGAITRSTIGTYFDSAGVMQTAAIDAIRINHDPYTKEFKGVLIENAATNRLLRSEDFDIAAWTKTRTSITANAILAPNNTTTAEKLVEDTTASSNHFISQNASLEASTIYTLSIYAKAAERSRIVLQTGNVSSWSNAISVGFDLTNGSLFSVSGNPTTSGVIKYIGNGWYRCSITKAFGDTSGAGALSVYLANSTGSMVYTGDGTSGIYIWGAQIEAGTFATSYIKTTTAEVTRAADIITGSGLVYTNVTNAYAEWSSGTTYALGTSVSYGVYGTYISLQNSNLNQNPLTATSYWLRTGPTNKMAAFDDQISSVTSSTSDIIFAVTASSIDTVALLNVTGGKTSIAITDTSSRTEVYHNSQQLSGSESIDWYSYFFYDADTVRTMSVYLDIPTASNSLISVKISGTGTISIGGFINGILKVLGDTQYGVSAGIIDYSRKDTDEFGNITFIKRNFSKRINASVSLTNANLNKVQRILYQYRATPVLWIASKDVQFEEPLIIYGFYRDFSTEISYPTHSICNLQIEGLI